MRLKSWSQMLFRKVQKSQQNMQSTSLKEKKVSSKTFRLREFISHDSLSSFGPITVKKKLL